MKNKLKVVFLSGLILTLGGCTNIQDKFGGIQDKFTGIQNKLSGTPTYTEIDENNFNVQAETQLFAVGNYKVNESGIAVAKMKAKEEAEIQLKKLISNEATNILDAFFNEIHTKNIITSKSTKEDLANLASSELIDDIIVANSWNNENEEFISLAIDKNIIPKKVKEIFITHIQDIIDDLDNAINKISNEFPDTTNPSIATTVIETTQVEQNETVTLNETIDTEVIESNVTIEDSNLETNSEPEVFLDDF